MKVLSEEEKQEFVKNLIEVKKRTEKDWDELKKHIHWESPFTEFRDEDEESYFHYLPEIFSEAKNKIEQQSRRNGVSSTKENWLWIENIKNSAPWKNFCKMMREAKWSEKRLETVQRQSLEIVNNLTNPKKLDTPKDAAIKKGLVYGNVQSGKTSHIAALIAMYASAGCNMIIVFSGVTKNLRNQTQKRLRHDLGMDQYHCYDLLTDQTDLLSKQTQGIEGRYSSAKPVIGIFKKSPSALKRLLAYLNRINDKSFWNKKQVLIIDDECDQYSINVAPMKDEDDNNVEFERSTINRLLVQIANTFERYCFVGFTATPFANVLNELPGKDSFYPKDFIYPLEVNEKYFGAKKLFGSALENPDKNYEYMNSINIVDEEEISPKLNDFSQIPKSLKDAIYYFITATACKYYRGMEDDHSSMLVHLDMKIAVHSALKKAIDNHFDYVKRNYKSVRNIFKDVWNKEKNRNSFSRIEKLFGYSDSDKQSFEIPDFEELEIYINQVLNKLEIIVDNSSVPINERLFYDDDKSDVFIVIGGNTLSRGLTLEGLLVSYFYRTSKLYDTLLQMGRWFGYRIGYEDLARLYTTNEIAFKFSELADIEDELREQFENYGTDITPEEVSVKIRTLPSLQITRKMAMQNAVSTGINFSGHRPSTLFFPRYDKNWLKHNIDVTADFLNSLPSYEIKNGMFLFKNNGIDLVRSYIEKLNILPENRTCNKKLLLKYLDKAKSKNYLRNWNIVVMTNKSGKAFQLGKLQVNLLNRSKYDRKDPDEKTIYLKILSQPNNMLLDTDICETTPDNTPVPQKFILRHKYFENKHEEEPGLLVIYPVDKDSVARAGSSNRLDLKSPEHIIGCMLVFPNSKDIQMDNYMTIDLTGEISEYDKYDD